MNKNKFKYKSLYKPLTNDNFLSIYTEDFFINPLNSNFINFYYYNNDLNYELLEDNYENLKNIKYFYLKNFQNLNIGSNNVFLPKSYTSVLDSFRPDFDEND
jgi:hypothetical protein